MGDMLTNASAWLSSVRHDSMTQTIIYSRDNIDISIQATIGNSDFEVFDTQGFAQSIVSRDFLVRSIDLTFGDPKIGDVITDTDGRRYEVMRGSGLPQFRRSDAYGTTIRVHTQLTGDN